MGVRPRAVIDVYTAMSFLSKGNNKAYTLNIEIIKTVENWVAFVAKNPEKFQDFYPN